MQQSVKLTTDPGPRADSAAMSDDSERSPTANPAISLRLACCPGAMSPNPDSPRFAGLFPEPVEGQIAQGGWLNPCMVPHPPPCCTFTGCLAAEVTMNWFQASSGGLQKRGSGAGFLRATCGRSDRQLCGHVRRTSTLRTELGHPHSLESRNLTAARTASSRGVALILAVAQCAEISGLFVLRCYRCSRNCSRVVFTRRTGEKFLTSVAPSDMSLNKPAQRTMKQSGMHRCLSEMSAHSSSMSTDRTWYLLPAD